MSFETGLSGLQAASSQLKVAGNNIANASTSGFKRSRTEFSDVYAASVLGTGGNAVGTGVGLDAVSQQFSQGTISTTNNSLDLAINGQGFFILNKGGEILYTRAGAYSVNNEGYIVNSQGANLMGYKSDTTTDPEGQITGEKTKLKLDTANIPPVATTSVATTMNLNSASKAPTSPFLTGFTPTKPPALNTYNNVASTTIYDSLGASHVLNMYFVKNADDVNKPNTWQMFTGIDGYDVTPAPNNAVPVPFTVVFDNNGNFKVNDPTKPPLFSTVATLSSTASSFTNPGAYSKITYGDLVINGVSIPAPANDTHSPVTVPNDKDVSAEAIATAIAGSPVLNTNTTASTVVSGLSVQITPAKVSLGKFTNPSTSGLFAAGDLVINGRNIIGTAGNSGNIADSTDLVTAINYAMRTNNEPIQASIVNGEVVLQGATVVNGGTTTVADGRNIVVQSGTTTLNGATLSNFPLGSVANTKVQRGGVTLRQAGTTPITITGAQPTVAGFVTGTTFANFINSNSDAIQVSGFNPHNGADVLDIKLDFDNSTQFGAEFAVQALLQDGSTTGRLAGVDADSSGILFARFTNGRSRKLGQVILANFANQQGLQPQGNSNWSETFTSGAALEGVPKSSNLGAVASGSLEDSNTDLTQELVNLIIAQRNFQANAQTIKTSDTVTQTVINLR